MNFRSPGHTLLEVLLTLAILGVVAGMAAPPLASALDGIAVRSARTQLIAFATRTRSIARLHGGARLGLDAGEDRAWIEYGGVARDTLDFADAGIDFILSTPAATRIIRYDALGIGRLANESMELRRGRVSARATVSAYGRLRAW